jgi:endonuclease YncB( thermonuclease family)
MTVSRQVVRKRVISAGLMAGLLFMAAAASAAPAIQGTASVIDGDTIEIRGERIRLDAIDAPESSQLCLDAAGKRYRCGQKSAFALADMIGRSVVSCEPKGRDRYKRTIAVCFKGDTNLNAWMVAQGWAVAFRKYGIDYIGEEDEARLARRGIWVGSFEMPWGWRARNK